MKYAVYYGNLSYVARLPAAEVLSSLSKDKPFTIVGIRDDAPDVITGDFLGFILDWYENGTVPLHEYSTYEERARFIAFGEEHPAFKYAVHAFDAIHCGMLPDCYRDFVVKTEDEGYAKALGFQAAKDVIEHFSDSCESMWDEARARTDTIEQANSLYAAMVARDSQVVVRKISPAAPDTIEGSFFDFCPKWEVR